MEKLSELSEPVAWTDERGNLCTNRNKERGLESRYHQDYEKYTTPFYSQEYVSALLAELEASKKSNAFLKEQLAKLANFNPDWDMLEACRESWREVTDALKEAEAKLATPVRLPRPACTYADHSYPAYSRKQVEEIITSAGMRFTVEGDE